jgi:hypothetical protein
MADPRVFKLLALWRKAIASFLLVAGVALLPSVGHSQSNFAPGFAKLPAGTKVALVPLDVAIFEIDLNNFITPKPDWTQTVVENIQKEYLTLAQSLNIQFVEMKPNTDQVAELQRMHLILARAITLHHFDRKRRLVSKKGELDWNIGAETGDLKQRTGADYALLTVVRDVRGTTGRELALGAITIASFAASAAAGGGMFVVFGTQQIAHATLIELGTGRIVWTSSPLEWSTRNRGPYDFRQRDQANELIATFFADYSR